MTEDGPIADHTIGITVADATITGLIPEVMTTDAVHIGMTPSTGILADAAMGMSDVIP